MMRTPVDNSVSGPSSTAAKETAALDSSAAPLERLSSRITRLLEKKSIDSEELSALLANERVEDIALALEQIELTHCARIFGILDEEAAARVLPLLEPERLQAISSSLHPSHCTRLLEQLTPREAARVVAESTAEVIHQARSCMPNIASDAESRTAFPEHSAGRMMTNAFVRLAADMTVAQALAILRQTDSDVDLPANLYVVDSDADGRDTLLGVISIRGLIMAQPASRVSDVMTSDVITIAGDKDDGVALHLLSEHKFSTLPVLNREGYLVGVIPAEDLMGVVVTRLKRRYARSVGTDAERMEHATPLQAARIRLPWLLGTMVLELGAGVVIARFSGILEKVILLASFMPVISAVAGNVGLQAAAITVRGLDTGQMSMARRGAAVFKETYVTILMGAVCAAVLGGIGMVWSGDVMFAIVIAIALGCSMLTASVMGTLIPMVSKKFGFDPATTAGPFETAFQDIIGFAVFLALATLLLR